MMDGVWIYPFNRVERFERVGELERISMYNNSQWNTRSFACACAPSFRSSVTLKQ